MAHHAFVALHQDLERLATGQAPFSCDAAARIIAAAERGIATMLATTLPPSCARYLAVAAEAAEHRNLPRFLNAVDSALLKAERILVTGSR